MGYTTGATVQTSALMSDLPESYEHAASEAVPVQPGDEFAPRLPLRRLRDACRSALHRSPYVVAATHE
jgi:hypothetical protein